MTMKERMELMVVTLCTKMGITINMDCAGVIVKDDSGKVLLVQEKKRIRGIFGKWNLPMGRMKRNESGNSCALREGKEETGYDLVLKDHYHFYSRTVKISPIKMTAVIYSAKVVGGELMVPPDMLDVKWFSLEEILKLEKEGKLISSYVRYMAESGE